jgi:CRISPR-associated protein Cas1
MEGAGSAACFGLFARLLRQELGFRRRIRRPPTDPVNALLSYGYAILASQCASAVNTVGLDPFVGYLHVAEYGRPALALDLMEEFRPLIVDSVVLSLLNNRELAAGDFSEELGSFRLTGAGRRTFLSRLEERLNTTINHPVFGYQATYRRCLELQARLLAKFLTGEISAYVPFTVR